MQKNLFIVLWGIVAIALTLYSFAQVDLSLTLSRASFLQTFQKSFQYIGYFNRPLSTFIFISIMAGMTALYILTVKTVYKEAIKRNVIWISIILLSIVFFFSYNAFSHDFFNYIFDAKIITHYQQNPYEHKALDFPNDPMLSFMHWTHRTYPYGPTWLLLTVPLSFLGMGYFIITFYLFKALCVISFLICCYYIEKIAQKTKVVSPLLALSFFAFNPLVITESLVSPHLDIVMMAASLAALYFLVQKKNVTSFIFLIFSIGVKFATAFLIPVFLLKGIVKKISYEWMFITAVVFMLLSVVAATFRTNFQPWYLVDALPFAALVSHKRYIVVPSILLSVAGLLQYVPYLYTGNWNPPIPFILSLILGVAMLLSALFIAFDVLINSSRNR